MPSSSLSEPVQYSIPMFCGDHEVEHYSRKPCETTRTTKGGKNKMAACTEEFDESDLLAFQ